MWGLIVSVPDHCLSFYFTQTVYTYAPWSKASKMNHVKYGEDLSLATAAKTCGVVWHIFFEQ